MAMNDYILQYRQRGRQSSVYSSMPQLELERELTL